MFKGIKQGLKTMSIFDESDKTHELMLRGGNSPKISECSLSHHRPGQAWDGCSFEKGFSLSLGCSVPKNLQLGSSDSRNPSFCS